MAAETYGGADIRALFFGGGTPSIMPLKAMEGVWRALHDSFRVMPSAECTAEANPGTLTPEWLKLMRDNGMNRLSLGVQASQNRHLKTLGRIHTFAQAREAVSLARQYGIANLNTDIMFGLPGQSLEDYLETLYEVAALKPEHISAYGLILESGTPLYDAVIRGERVIPTDDEAAGMVEHGCEWLARRGYHQYEISNFALEGYECEHNLGYWQGAWYLGLGLGAHSMLPAEEKDSSYLYTEINSPVTERPHNENGSPCIGKLRIKNGFAYLRAENTTDMEMYRSMIESGVTPISQTTGIPHKEAMFETMMLGLRTVSGVNSIAFLARHGEPLERVYGQRLNTLAGEGLGFWKDDKKGGRSFALTPKGLLLENQVLLGLMDHYIS